MTFKRDWMNTDVCPTVVHIKKPRDDQTFVI